MLSARILTYTLTKTMGVPVMLAYGEWRAFLKSYIEQVNRAMVTGRSDELARAFWDAEDRRQEAVRWQREFAQLKSRRAVPLTAQISARPLHAQERGPNQVDVVLKLNQQLRYRHGEQPLQQQVSLTKKVSLQRINGKWGFQKQWEPISLSPSGTVANVGGQVGHFAFTEGFAFQSGKEEQHREHVQPAVPVIKGQGGGYDRLRAVLYADTHWDNPNPAYPYLVVDCTNFISQCLYAGGIPMISTGNKSTGWWFRGWHENWSYSWAVADSLHRLLASGKAPMRAVRKSSPEELELGDIICYDFDGDGHWQHNTIVTGKDSNGMPLVNAHTTNSSKRYWEYKDSTAYTDNIKYDFFHIRGNE
ncbi:hypothetical protein EDM56_12605 [Brevibacillus fluminis]|uniref:Putative amidase domain-containing protein n=2 Tax=Brevibacillus fluminis TaxID=511487 RepID=A0A3M8DPD1_9BACL|nr:hypothetical protein EDM56_12605 [Brevibacillus fluminis]